jgi:GABA permease
VLAARREAPVRLITVNSRGVPTWAILSSTVIGFLCVIAAYISPDTVFSFLLNSSGAIILFVYLLIAVSQVVLRRRTDPEKLRVKMWLFPVLSLLTIASIVGVLISMGVKEDTRSQLVLSLVSWAVVLVLYYVTRRMGGSVTAEAMDSQVSTGPATRVLVLANETVGAPELLSELHRIDADGKAEYFVSVPANPVDTGQAELTGAAFVWEATVEAAQRRLDETLGVLADNGLRAEGALGDYRPLVALSEAAKTFRPDRIVISTHKPEHSAWLGQDVVTRARAQFDVPVTHIVAASVVAGA